ncbi:MAG: hypothetical protein NVSMB55_12900 [Mycobacteriales bacterium]
MRRGEIPPVVTRAWTASVLLGGVVVALGPVHRLSPLGLTPATLPSYLARGVGPTARDVRVNGVYGSGRDGAWQFVAHLTWRTSAGVVTGGVLTLPQQAGGPAADSPVPADRLVDEQARGWTLTELGRETAVVGPVDAAAALLELEIPTSDDGTVTFCAADGGGRASCSSRGRAGVARSFSARVEVNAADGALSVRRSGS